jgi:hypothetical protein
MSVSRVLDGAAVAMPALTVARMSPFPSMQGSAAKAARMRSATT